MPRIPSRRVVVVGQGYVGLPLAMRAIEAGYDVVGYDVDERRIERLASGESYVEDISAEALGAALATGRYRPSFESKSCAGFDVAVITVPTPLREGNPDLSYIESAATTLARFLRPGSTVILESTTYPGTTEELVGPLLENGSGLTMGTDFHLGYSPERIDPGNTVWTFANTPKVVSWRRRAVAECRSRLLRLPGGADGACQRHSRGRAYETPREYFPPCEYRFGQRDHDVRPRARCRRLGMHRGSVEQALCFMRFAPGPGVGGHCLPIDPSYLSWRIRRTVGQSFRFVELANDVNEHMPDYVVQRLVIALNRQKKAVNGSLILLLGLAYKRNTGDARESPASAIIDRLLQLGADIRAADPFVVEEHIDLRVTRVEATPRELAAADAAILLTDHDAFDYATINAKARLVLDTRHRLEGPNVEYL